MKPLSAFLAVLLLSAAGQAQTVLVNGLPNGAYILQVNGASVNVTPATIATIGGVVPPVGPEVPPVVVGPTDPPTPTTTLGKSVKLAADAVKGDPTREQTAGALALVYQQGADFIKSGTITNTAQATAWARMGSDLVLTKLGNGPAWQPTRDTIGAGLDDLARKGQLTTVAQYGAAFEQIAGGLSSSAGDQSAFDFAKFIELLLKLLPLILALFGG